MLGQAGLYTATGTRIAEIDEVIAQSPKEFPCTGHLQFTRAENPRPPRKCPCGSPLENATIRQVDVNTGVDTDENMKRRELLVFPIVIQCLTELQLQTAKTIRNITVFYLYIYAQSMYLSLWWRKISSFRSFFRRSYRQRQRRQCGTPTYRPKRTYYESLTLAVTSRVARAPRI